MSSPKMTRMLGLPPDGAGACGCCACAARMGFAAATVDAAASVVPASRILRRLRSPLFSFNADRSSDLDMTRFLTSACVQLALFVQLPYVARHFEAANETGVARQSASLRSDAAGLLCRLKGRPFARELLPDALLALHASRER